MAVRYRERPAAMQALLRAPGGPVARLVDRTADEVIDNARTLAFSHRVSGDYDSRFRRESSSRSKGPGARVINSSDHAMILERGSVPHIITPRGPGYPLRFVSGGRVVYAYRVQHPGTRPYNFMADALRLAMNGV